MATSTLTQSFNVSRIYNKEYPVDVFLNIAKPNETILYEAQSSTSRPRISFCSTTVLNSRDNVSIFDKSTRFAENTIPARAPVTKVGITSFEITSDNFVLTDVFTQET